MSPSQDLYKFSIPAIVTANCAPSYTQNEPIFFPDFVGAEISTPATSDDRCNIISTLYWAEKIQACMNPGKFVGLYKP